MRGSLAVERPTQGSQVDRCPVPVALTDVEIDATKRDARFQR